MWKYIRLFLPILIIGFVAPMIMPGSNGKPIMSPSDWLPDKKSLEKISNSLSKVANTASQVTQGEPIFKETKQQLYKWKDKKGNWQFTDNIKNVPDYALAQLKSENLPKAINSMAPPPMPVAEEAAASTFSPFTTDGSVDISKMPELVDEAKKAREKMESRNAVLEEL